MYTYKNKNENDKYKIGQIKKMLIITNQKNKVDKEK